MKKKKYCLTQEPNRKEIVRLAEITRVPNAPYYVEGACNLRGNVLPIIDGRARFGMEKKASDENSRVLVIDVEGKATGVVVDRVSEVMRVSNSDIEPTPTIFRNYDADYLNGVVKLEHGNRLIMLLDVVKALYTDDSQSEEPIRDNSRAMSQEVKKNEVVVKESMEEEHLVSFSIDKSEYAIGIMQVKEIIRIPDFIKVPNCESYIEGLASIRNNLLPIINLRTYFGIPKADVTDHTRVLVVDMGSFTAGVMVDKVSEVIRVPSNVIQPPPKLSHQNNDQLKGVAKLNDGKRLILMLEPQRLISFEEYQSIRNLDQTTSVDEETKSMERQLLDEEQLVTFRLDKEEYGIKVSLVQEINRMIDITKIPRAPAFIDGIVNLRGNVIPALNLRKLFGLSHKEKNDATRIIIVDDNGKKTGIVVDSVSEVLRFEKNLIDPPPSILSSGVDTEYVEGVGKLNNGKRMILILNLAKVLGYSAAVNAGEDDYEVKDWEEVKGVKRAAPKSGSKTKRQTK